MKPGQQTSLLHRSLFQTSLHFITDLSPPVPRLTTAATGVNTRASRRSCARRASTTSTSSQTARSSTTTPFSRRSAWTRCRCEKPTTEFPVLPPLLILSPARFLCLNLQRLNLPIKCVMSKFFSSHSSAVYRRSNRPFPRLLSHIPLSVALFLGPRFVSFGSSSKAAELVQR